MNRKKLKASLLSIIGNTSGERISEITNGANLVDGKETWEYAKNYKDNIEVMKKCCDAELKTMKAANSVPAPFYFERVIILSRKKKDYKQEIEYCEKYMEAVDQYYNNIDIYSAADVRKGSTYKSIVDRLSKARRLLNE